MGDFGHIKPHLGYVLRTHQMGAPVLPAGTGSEYSPGGVGPCFFAYPFAGIKKNRLPPTTTTVICRLDGDRGASFLIPGGAARSQ